MTYLELKVAALQKMFAITGNTVVNDDTTQPYILSIPQAANEGIDLIVQSGRPVRSCGVIHQMAELPAEEDLVEGDGYGVTAERGVNRYDMEALIGPTYRRIDTANVFYSDDAGSYAATRLFDVEAGRYLLLPAYKAGQWRVWAVCIPEAVKISEATADDFELPLPKECCDILPLYIASQLYKDDDISMATIWRNEFNVALETLAAQEAESSGGSCGSFESETGWW